MELVSSLRARSGPSCVAHIMTHKIPQLRPAMTAIAAVLALSSTPLLAQAAPDVTQPVTAAPATPVPESAPPAATPSEPSATTASDPLAAEPTITNKKSSKSTATRRAPTSARAAKPAAPVARAAAPARVAPPAAAPAETAAPAAVPVAAVPAAPAPAAPLAAMPAQKPPVESNTMLPIAGGVGLALLGLIAVGVALRRRKRRSEEEFAVDQQYEPASEALAQADPLFAPESSAPLPADSASIFASEAAPAVASATAGSPSDCADAPPGSHVEAACEGPTPDNPSLSIKKRLKRAHFFDQREFLAAAGEATPVAADAGLPDALAAPEPPSDEPA